MPPGHPKWAVAPIEMAWERRTLGQICEQIKDPKRNGGKTLARIQGHMAHDTLVGWAWSPGASRKPVSGTQAQFVRADRRVGRVGRRVCPTP